MDWNNTSNLILSCKAMSSEKHRSFFFLSQILFGSANPIYPLPFLFLSFLSNKQSTGSEHSHTARFPLRSIRGTANPLPPRLPSSFPLSFSASHSLSSLPYRIALHAALQRIQHDVNQLVERHCSSLHSIPFIQSSLTVTTFVSSFKKRRDRAVFAL